MDDRFNNCFIIDNSVILFLEKKMKSIILFSSVFKNFISRDFLKIEFR